MTAHDTLPAGTRGGAAGAACRITHVRHVALGVSDLHRARRFYRDIWHLDLVGDDSDMAWFGAGCAEPFILRLRSEQDQRTDLVALGAASRQHVDEVADIVARAGATVIREPGLLDGPGGGYGLRFFDPDGRVLEVSADVTPRAFREVEPTESRPRKLSHVVLNTPDIDGTRWFYEQVLGFRVSDWLGDAMCFLRCNREHHAIALFRAPHVSVNHISFEMRGVDEFMRGTGRLVRSGNRPLWGPGRHGPGNNTFSYFRDSEGFVVEYTTELEHIDEARGWCPQVWEMTPEKSDLWGTGGELSDATIAALLGVADAGTWKPPPA